MEMSKRELGRVEVLARVRSKQLRVVDAARLMRVSWRQGKRLWKRYGEEGAAGLKHRSAGRPSNRAYEEKFRQKVLRLVREKYGGPVGERFGPTLAAEHLASEDGLQVDAETLRRWMLAEGLWSRQRKRRHRRRRERKEHFGEMVQMDGSFHYWLEERGPQGCLIDLVDDATNTTWAQLGEHPASQRFGIHLQPILRCQVLRRQRRREALTDRPTVLHVPLIGPPKGGQIGADGDEHVPFLAEFVGGRKRDGTPNRPMRDQSVRQASR